MGKVLDEDIKLAQKVESTYGVPASVVLGQKIQETGWNESTVGKNNYFNIKGSGQGGYRDYNSKEESFMDYGKLLSGSRYTQYTKDAETPEEFITGIKKAGYAEDPNYVKNVMAVISDNDLTQYDSGKTVSSGSGFASNNVTWWGDIVTVVFAIILIIMGVVFIGLSVTNNSVMDSVTDTIKKVVK